MCITIKKLASERSLGEDAWLEDLQNAGALDVLKELGDISKEELDYYNNPGNFKKYSADKV